MIMSVAIKGQIIYLLELFVTLSTKALVIEATSQRTRDVAVANVVTNVRR